ncbi:hypothetical protein [Pseudomonas sp. RIT623]|uniref:hypothetical protein n=1 Tax=Pseudomonas sp. RIT623 TaxID=2559075 RepID=UPI00106F8906|nr:hypothetical protein [Pseudomonas sp. RIT623]TFF33714.1 hypothetical protein E3U47_24675 [Pseudomonas sp. RIT623]
MFDDYVYKNIETRVRFKFIQRRDEPLYPWEIASFLKGFNTVYYKFELLNSICSALNHGVAAEDIIIFDHSLPLYERYAEMNLISEAYAAKLFYPIGLPVALVPSEWSRNYRYLYLAFKSVNSLLKIRRVQPLRLEAVVGLYESLGVEGVELVRSRLIDLALDQAEKSYRIAVEKGKKKKELKRGDVERALVEADKFRRQSDKDLLQLSGLTDDERLELLTSNARDERRLANFLTSFFDKFDATVRPLVCARVGHGKLRVLGRSLVNKQERTGLELKEIKKNSPLGALFEAGVTAYQAFQQEKRAKELHEIDKKIKAKEIELLDAKIHGEKIKNFELEMQAADCYLKIARESDLTALKGLPPSFVQTQIVKAYGIEMSNAAGVLNKQDLRMDYGSIQTIDLNV